MGDRVCQNYLSLDDINKNRIEETSSIPCLNTSQLSVDKREEETKSMSFP